MKPNCAKVVFMIGQQRKSRKYNSINFKNGSFMEFTGEFYPFYSDKPIEIVVQKMLDFAKSIGYQWEYFNQEE